MKHFYLFFVIFLSSNLHAQESADGLSIVCKHGEISHSIPSATIPSKLKTSQTFTATFIPTYTNVPEAAITEIQKALDIWSIILISKTAIRIDISWEQLESNILATTGTPKVYKNFKNAPFKEVWYPPALANALNGERLGSAKEADITLRINSKIDWNLSTLGLGPPGLGGFDMTTVILHEVAHGLGFIASFEENLTGKAQWGIQNLPLIYDTFLTDESNNKLTNNRFYNNNSEKLLQAVTSNKVFFAIDSGSYSPNVLQMHTVTPYRTGASLSHISNRLPLEDPNDGLMFSALTYRNRYSFPGNGTLAILFQMGWALNFYEFEREYPESDVPKVSIYPNPSQNIITLETKNITATQYSIVDFQGREIKRGTIAPLKTEISINDLSTGKYILKAGPISSVFLKF